MFPFSSLVFLSYQSKDLIMSTVDFTGDSEDDSGMDVITPVIGSSMTNKTPSSSIFSRNTWK
jgi:hypothetical protein